MAITHRVTALHMLISADLNEVSRKESLSCSLNTEVELSMTRSNGTRSALIRF